MTAFMQSRTCCHQVLSKYFDQVTAASTVDCVSTGSIFCDTCTAQCQEVRPREQEEDRAPPRAGYQWEGQQFIANQLRQSQESYETMIRVMGQLQGQCIYCALTEEGILAGTGRGHKYSECQNAKAAGCGMIEFKQWRCNIDFR